VWSVAGTRAWPIDGGLWKREDETGIQRAGES
jgi:hypothetical protein